MTTETVAPVAILSKWADFYRAHEMESGSLVDVRVPPLQMGFDRLLVVPQGLTFAQVYIACEKRFKCWMSPPMVSAMTLNANTFRNDRNPRDAPYTVWVRETANSDRILRLHSAQRLWELGIAGITLLERLVYGLMYRHELGIDLDQSTMTLCHGSRIMYEGDIHCPVVYTKNGTMVIDLFQDDLSGHELRARQVISL